MKRFEVLITKQHWVWVEAETEDEAYQLAEDQMPTFSSDFEDGGMEITETINQHEEK